MLGMQIWFGNNGNNGGCALEQWDLHAITLGAMSPVLSSSYLRGVTFVIVVSFDLAYSGLRWLGIE